MLGVRSSQRGAERGGRARDLDRYSLANVEGGIAVDFQKPSLALIPQDQLLPGSHEQPGDYKQTIRYHAENAMLSWGSASISSFLFRN